LSKGAVALHFNPLFQGSSQKQEDYFDDMFHYYTTNFSSKDYPARPKLGIVNKWKDISSKCMKFTGHYKIAAALCQKESSRSGQTSWTEDVVGKAYDLYKESENEDFLYYGCWQLLREQPKWSTEFSKSMKGFGRVSKTPPSSAPPSACKTSPIEITNGFKEATLDKSSSLAENLPVQSGAQPPSWGNGAQPPSWGNGAQPPSWGNGAQPPSWGNGAQPPSWGSGNPQFQQFNWPYYPGMLPHHPYQQPWGAAPGVSMNQERQKLQQQNEHQHQQLQQLQHQHQQHQQYQEHQQQQHQEQQEHQQQQQHQHQQHQENQQRQQQQHQQYQQLQEQEHHQQHSEQEQSDGQDGHEWRQRNRDVDLIQPTQLFADEFDMNDGMSWQEETKEGSVEKHGEDTKNSLSNDHPPGHPQNPIGCKKAKKIRKLQVTR
jgi:hypothetical protein